MAIVLPGALVVLVSVLVSYIAYKKGQSFGWVRKAYFAVLLFHCIFIAHASFCEINGWDEGYCSAGPGGPLFGIGIIWGVILIPVTIVLSVIFLVRDFIYLNKKL